MSTENANSNLIHKTTIGGQALIEGIMMVGPNRNAMAVRLPDQTIDVETWDKPSGQKPFYKTTPFIRGSFNFVETMINGYRCLMKSAEKAGLEEEPGKFEIWLAKTFGANLSKVMGIMAAVLGGGLAILMFIVLPTVVSRLLTPFIPSHVALSAIEGCLKIAIFIIYLALVSKIPDIHRVFQYHGAEHKTISCYEHGEVLTVENIRKYTRFHPRCGTSFLLIVLVISILVFSVVTWSSTVIRILLKIVLLPVVVGIAYEIIKLAGRYDNALTRIISAPGLWLQRLTTAEPDDSMLEVAIASVQPVIPEDKADDQW